MALSPELLNFKSSGIYRVEIDRSQTTTFNLTNLRLIVGHSRKGPYNSPVVIENSEQFIQIFGNIDRNLERKGMFFHRSVLNALSRGPVLAMNILPADSGDTVDWFEPVTSASTATSNVGNGTDLEYANVFNQDKFWFPSDEKVLEDATIDDSHVIRFINLKQNPITIITRQAQDVGSFNITARDWYGEGNVPEYMNEYDYVSDFMVDIFVFKGEFDPAKLANDPVFGAYFSTTGIDKSKLNEFANLRQVELLAQYTGSIIPNFRDLEGRSLYIETIINNEVGRTGLFCAVDEDRVTDSTGTKVDFVGHSFTTPTSGATHNLLSYSITDSDRIIAYTYPAYSASGNSFTVDNSVAMPLLVGDYVPSSISGRMAKITKISISGSTYTVVCDQEVSSSTPTIYATTFEKAADEYVPFVLDKAIIGDKTIVGCLNTLITGTNLYNALTDKDLVDFRYIVDTFGSFDTVNGTILNKNQLSKLAHDRQNVSAILNAPSIAEFKKSTNPSFTDDNGNFSVSYIATGGNLAKNTTLTYSLPSIQQGSNYSFYYGPYLSVLENGKTILVPPAAYVSNNYIDKYNNDLPWSIVAGPRRGVVSGVNVSGVEYPFDKLDRDILEPFGINPIVFQRGVGLTILGNKTAQQNIKSSLSSAHVREVLIYIQNRMADILKDYVFEFNTAQTRLEIKTLADSLMESIKQNDGIYDYRNIMDQTNNTNEVIDNNIGIIDTYVEPVKGLEIVVHRTTILNTGEIQTGNFT